MLSAPSSIISPSEAREGRVIFSCSVKYQGSSLNDQLLQGPDLTKTVVGVLMRFREEPVAFMADIKAMFYQVRVQVFGLQVFAISLVAIQRSGKRTRGISDVSPLV